MVMLRVDGRYVRWHSYQNRWFLGPRRLSEKFYHPLFGSNRRLDTALDHFPTARVIWADTPE